MQISKAEVLKRIKPDWKVLDIGGWEDPLPRANVVLDINPYETRKRRNSEEPELFTADTWLIGDICQRSTWLRFGEKEFDYVICTHVLEDIRDPLFVCEQLNRVAKAGYIECPSRFRECAKANVGDLHNGYDHHRWILDIVDGELSFTAKLHWANFFDFIGDQRPYLQDYQAHFVSVFWQGSFNYYERFPKGELMESAELFRFYGKYEYYKTKFIFEITDGLVSPKVKTGSMLWVTEFKLPIELEPPDVREAFVQRARAEKQKLGRRRSLLDWSPWVFGRHRLQLVRAGMRKLRAILRSGRFGAVRRLWVEMRQRISFPLAGRNRD